MNPLWTNIIARTVLRNKTTPIEQYSQYRTAKKFRELKITTVRWIKDFILILFGILSATFGLEGFLLPNEFIDGGVTGISLLITELTSLPLYVLLLTINIPFVFLGYRVVGLQFAIKTALAITGLALSVAVFSFPEVTQEKLLVAVFGGFFLGAGIGLAVRGGAVIDGTEVLAIFLSKKFGSTIGDVIIAVNVLVFSAAAYFLSVEAALYSMITYLSASKTLDFIVEGIDEYVGVTIVSVDNEEIREMIVNNIGRGVTIYKGQRGVGKRGVQNDIDIVYTVVTRLELNKLNTEIQKIDQNAFIVMSNVKDTKGGMIKKRSVGN
ncbi:MAG: YitT family protein [Ignavibacteria bacterium]|nr:YitT family protein [Ignavibacteria bacterium]